MADINIQRKKASPSPWLLVLLAAVAIAVAAYFFLRPEPVDEPAPPAATPEAVAPGTAPDTLTAAAAVDQATRRAAIDAIPQGDSAGSSETAASLSAQAASDPGAPDYARNGLQKLAGVLVSLTDRDDLRDPGITEQRDNLTSSISRLDEPNSSLRPGFVAAAGLIRAMQQKAYPELETQANDLVSLAGQLSGRGATAAEQRQNQQFLTKAAAAVRVLSEPKN